MYAIARKILELLFCRPSFLLRRRRETMLVPWFEHQPELRFTPNAASCVSTTSHPTKGRAICTVQNASFERFFRTEPLLKSDHSRISYHLIDFGWYVVDTNNSGIYLLLLLQSPPTSTPTLTIIRIHGGHWASAVHIWA